MKNYKFHYVYKTTNLITQEYYIGKHSSNNLENDYLGSGVDLKKALTKFSKENFTKEILSTHNSSADAFLEEEKIVTKDLVNDPNCYNLTTGGHGGCKTVWTDEKRKALSEKQKGKIPWMKGKNHTEESKKKQSESAKKRCDKQGNNQTGLKRSNETKKKQSDAWNDERITKHNEWNKTKWTTESRLKLSKSQKGVSINSGLQNPSKKVVYNGESYYIHQLAKKHNKKCKEVAEYLGITE